MREHHNRLQDQGHTVCYTLVEVKLPVFGQLYLRHLQLHNEALPVRTV